jgi:hypothetical protein
LFCYFVNTLLIVRADNPGSVALQGPLEDFAEVPWCGVIDSRNCNAEKFRCGCCSFEEWADIVSAPNLKALGLAGAYSLRSPKPYMLIMLLKR